MKFALYSIVRQGKPYMRWCNIPWGIAIGFHSCHFFCISTTCHGARNDERNTFIRNVCSASLRHSLRAGWCSSAFRWRCGKRLQCGSDYCPHFIDLDWRRCPDRSCRKRAAPGTEYHHNDQERSSLFHGSLYSPEDFHPSIQTLDQAILFLRMPILSISNSTMSPCLSQGP